VRSKQSKRPAFLAVCFILASFLNAQSTLFHLKQQGSTFEAIPIKSIMRILAQEVKMPISLKYNPPKLPFFCSMEDKFRAKHRVFLKIRTGNDEDYRKMIKP
jgi:hypothetical protein